MTDLVLCERRGRVALWTLNRPDVLNALNGALLETLHERLEEIEHEPELRALVITGAGRAFAGGADIGELRGFDPPAAEAFSALGQSAFARLEALAIPTLAAVNGFALGGGLELACACDWIYASPRARFGQPEVNLGLIPGFGGTSRLLRRVGMAWAKELVVTGEPIDAETALRIGLVNRLCEPDALLECALAAGEKIASKGPLAVARAKQVLQQGQDADVRLAHVLERTAFGLLFSSADRREGIEAFLAKRAPQFEGR